MYVVNGSDGRCLVAVRLIVGVRYLERPLREVLLYTVFHPLTARASIFFGGPFTRRLLETGAYSRQAFIFTCTIFERARAPFDAQR